MTAKQARNILKHTVVMRNGDPLCKGTVMEVGYSGFQVRWENGTAEWVAQRGAQHVDEWYPQPQKDTQP
jgi:hypothetical protein